MTQEEVALREMATKAKTGVVKLFQTTVIGMGPFCIKYADGEIIVMRSAERQAFLAAANPLAILALLAKLERYEMALENILTAQDQGDEIMVIETASAALEPT